MILKSYRGASRLLAAGLIAGAGAFIGQGAAQAETYFPCASQTNQTGSIANNTGVTGNAFGNLNAQTQGGAVNGNCSTLTTAGANAGVVTNPLSIATGNVGGGTSTVTITTNQGPNNAYGILLNGGTKIQSANAGFSAYGSFSSNAAAVGWFDGNSYTGLTVDGTRTVLSGGTAGVNSTQLVLNGTNATFSNSATGAPITVTGVADGYNAFDAVNFRQLQAVSTGVASIAAMSNIPALDANKKFGIGIGYGNFQGNSALAVGVNGRLSKSLTAKVSVGAGLSYGATSVGTGLSYSW